MVISYRYEKIITKLSEELELRKYIPKTKNAYIYNVGRYLKWSERNTLQMNMLESIFYN